MKALGFSMAMAARDAVCFEDHPVRKHIAKFTIKQCQMNPRMAQYKLEEVKVGRAVT